jgi:uncharacterized membrane protein
MPQHATQIKRHHPLLLIGLLMAFALRVYYLGDQNIWWDEGLAIWAVRHGFVETTLWTAGDVHPPLYFWLLWPWVRLVGESEFAARYLTVLTAMLTVAVMAPLGRRLGGRAVGAAALYLLALSRFHIWWSQEMRMYALAALAATLSFYFLVRAVSDNREEGNRKACPCIGWVAATVAALYTLYFSALLLVVQNLYVFIVSLRRTDRWALWRRWLPAQGAALALWAPWLALAIPRMRSWSVVQEPVSLRFVYLLDGVLLTLGISTYVERYLGAVLAMGLVLLWGTVALVAGARRVGTACRTAEGLWLLLLGTLIPPLMVWLVTQPRMLFYTPRVEARYFLSFAPLFYAWLAWALCPHPLPAAPPPLPHGAGEEEGVGGRGEGRAGAGPDALGPPWPLRRTPPTGRPAELSPRDLGPGTSDGCSGARLRRSLSALSVLLRPGTGPRRPTVGLSRAPLVADVG